MPATDPIARRVLMLVATTLLAGIIMAVPARAAESSRHRPDARHHRAHPARACAAKAVRGHKARRAGARRRRAACARAAGLPAVQFVAPTPEADIPTAGMLRARVRVHTVRRPDF